MVQLNFIRFIYPFFKYFMKLNKQCKIQRDINIFIAVNRNTLNYGIFLPSIQIFPKIQPTSSPIKIFFRMDFLSDFLHYKFENLKINEIGLVDKISHDRMSGFFFQTSFYFLIFRHLSKYFYHCVLQNFYNTFQFRKFKKRC